MSEIETQESKELELQAQHQAIQYRVSPAFGSLLLKTLLAFEGDHVFGEDPAVGDTVTCRWVCGIDVHANYLTGEKTFVAVGAYAQALMATLVSALANEPEPLKGHDPGTYVVIAVGSGDPESFRVLGPVPEAGVALLQNPKVLEAVTLLLQSTAVTTDSIHEPRLVAELKHFELTFGDLKIARFSEVIAPARFEKLLGFGEKLLDAIDADDAATIYDSERVHSRLAILRLKRQVAIAIASLGLG